MGKTNHDIVLENNVEFITCNDCRYSKKSVLDSSQEVVFCTLHAANMFRVDFCSNGEEKE